MIIPQIPDHWSPPEALAVFEFIDGLRERIWDHYGERIQEWEALDHITEEDNSQLDLFDPCQFPF
jgi:hypothetical protein